MQAAVRACTVPLLLCRGGSNKTGAAFLQNRRVAERDAHGVKARCVVRKQVRVKAIAGPAAQKQWLDMVGAICESQRKSTADSASTVAAGMNSCLNAMICTAIECHDLHSDSVPDMVCQSPAAVSSY